MTSEPDPTALARSIEDVINAPTPVARAEALQRNVDALLSEAAHGLISKNRDRLQGAGDAEAVDAIDSVIALMHRVRAEGLATAVEGLRTEQRLIDVRDLVNAPSIGAWGTALQQNADSLLDGETLTIVDGLIEAHIHDADASGYLRTARRFLEEGLAGGVDQATAWLRDQLLGKLAELAEAADPSGPDSVLADLRALAGPEEWANTHLTAVGLLRSARPAERGRSVAERVLSDGVDLAPSPVSAGILRMLLAQLLLEGPTAEEVDRAIDLLEQATNDVATVGTRVSGLFGELGRAHLIRKGRGSADLLAAKGHLERELAGAQDDDSSPNRAITHRLLSEVHDGLGDPAAAVRHLDAAIALQPPEPGEAGANVWLNLASVLFKTQGEDRPDALERAIEAITTAISLAPADTGARAWAHARLGDLLRYRLRGDRGENFALALQHLATAQTFFVRDRFPDAWAQLQHNEGTIHFQDLRGDRAAALERAISCYERALEVHTREAYPDFFGLTSTSIAAALIQRVAGSRQRNLEQALERLTAAESVLDRERSKVWWAECQTGLGTVRRELVEPARQEDLRLAIRHIGAARQAYRELGDVDRESQMDSNLAAVLIDLGAFDARAFDDAITAMKRALSRLNRDVDPYHWGLFKRNLAAARIRRSHAAPADLAQATADLNAALEVFAPTRYPVEAAKTLEYLGHLAFEGHDWAATERAYTESIRVGRAVFASAYTETGRRAAIRETGLQHVRAAFALAKVGRVGDALVILEQGKSRLLADTITLSGVDLAGVPQGIQARLRRDRDVVRALEGQLRAIIESGDGRAAEVGDRLAAGRIQLAATLNEASAHAPVLTRRLERWEEIVATIPSGGGLIAFVTTSEGSMAIVVPAAARHLGPEHVVDLDDVTMGRVNRMVEEWMSLLNLAPDRDSFQSWCRELTRLVGELWEPLVGPVHERLGRLGLPSGAPLVLLPQGALWLLPLHAAWRPVDGVSRALADDYVITYAPSMFVRSVCLERLRSRDVAAPSVLAIANPTGDLPYAAREASSIAELFATAHVLDSSNATSRRVEQEATTVSHLHFACHGSHDWADVMRSGLELAQRDRLTLDRILSSFTLDSCRLVALSACETGLTDVRLSADEHLGLPAGFLLAGAGGVISSLWKVDDAATFLLIRRFYELLLEERDPVSPDVALRDAQTWLRHVTVGDLRTLSRDLDLTSRYRDLDESSRPFDQPFYWAAFTFTGA